jgi:uncharacterized protein DUF4389
VRLTEDLALRRRRLAVLLRVLLLVPAALVACVWALVALVVLPFAWMGALVRGQVPRRLHRTEAAALTYLAQVNAWANLVSGRYPWPRRRSRHPVQLRAPRGQQPRWTVLLRLGLAVPPVVLASVLGVVLGGTAIGAWFVALVLGRTTEGLRELGAFCLRYETEVAAYLLLLTPRYPRLAPAPVEERAPPGEPRPAPGL